MDGSATGAESQGCAEKAFELVPLVRLEISMCLGWVGNGILAKQKTTMQVGSDGSVLCCCEEWKAE